MGEVAHQAFEEIPNIVDLFDEHDNLRPLHTLTLEQQRSIAGLDVVKRNLVAGDKKTDVVHKIRLWNIRAERTKAQELLAKLLKLVNNEPPGAPQVPMFAISCLPDFSPNPALPRSFASGGCPADRGHTNASKAANHLGRRCTDRRGRRQATRGAGQTWVGRGG
jgi:hypothetical protein